MCKKIITESSALDIKIMTMRTLLNNYNRKINSDKTFTLIAHEIMINERNNIKKSLSKLEFKLNLIKS
jgi:hypothetical protein